jgi:hypothetical protein
MGILITKKIRTIDASPVQMVTNADPTVTLDLVGFALSNTANTTDTWFHFYQETSGSVTVGTTEERLGPIMVPAGGYAFVHNGEQKNKIIDFSNAITVAATTTENGSTSPTSDCTVRLFYYK